MKIANKLMWISGVMIVISIIAIVGVTIVGVITGNWREDTVTTVELQVVRAEAELANNKLEQQFNADLQERFDALAQLLMEQEQHVAIAYQTAYGVGMSLQNIWSTLYCDGIISTPEYLHDVYFEGADSLCVAHDAYEASMERLFSEEPDK